MSAALNPDLEEAMAHLNTRQRAFVLAYKCGETKGNAGRSYEAAGYNSSGSAADANGSRLMSSDRVVRVLDYFDQTVSAAVVDEAIDYKREWYADLKKDLEAAREDGAHGPVMTGHKLLASSERYDVEVNRTTHDLAPELRNAIADRIAGARARTIQLNEGEE